jgi:nucleolar protein 15
MYNANTDTFLLASEEAAPALVKKSKTPKPYLEHSLKPKSTKKEATLDNATEKTNGNTSKGAKRTTKELKPLKGKESKQPKPIDPPSTAEDSDEEGEGEDDDSEIDDQTEALLKGFESDGDDEDAEKEGGLEDGHEIPRVPALSNRSKKQLQKATDFNDDKPGVVFVGRIPHGFYEHEMREYFKQFGTILKLRLSRNRRTSASRHIAWIQFESATVADIVAKTMDNYLLFNHILKVKVIPDEQVPANLWKGANKRFKKVPWNKMEARKLAEPKPEGVWEKLNAREQGRRDKKAEKLKAIGYEFDAPKLKSAKGVAKMKAEKPALIADGEVKAIEAIPKPVTEAEGSKKKEKKDRKPRAKAQAIEAAKPAPENTIDQVVEEKNNTKKEKNERKRKVAEVEDIAAAPIESVEKGLKTKKSKTELVEATNEVSEDKAKKSRKQKVKHIA